MISKSFNNTDFFKRGATAKAAFAHALALTLLFCGGTSAPSLAAGAVPANAAIEEDTVSEGLFPAAGQEKPSAVPRDSRAKAESDGLGLIIKNIEMIENKPILAAVFNTKTGRTIEYTVGDYIEGKLVRDILEDRIVLYDEVTKYQHVLIFNDVVSAGEEDDEIPVPVMRVRTKYKNDDDMDVTTQFNRHLARAKGKDFKYGAADKTSEAAEKAGLNRTTRDFKAPVQPIENRSADQTGEVSAEKPAAKGGTDTPASKGTVEVTATPRESSAQKAAGAEKSSAAATKPSAATGEVSAAKTSAALSGAKDASAATVKPATGPEGGSASTGEVSPSKPASSPASGSTTKDGRTVKPR